MAEGALPSVVYLIEAPAVAVLRVTLCAVEYVPAAGENTGVAAFSVFITKLAVVIFELVIPDMMATAFIVVVALIANVPA